MHKKQKSEYVAESLTEKICQAFVIPEIPLISILHYFVEKEQKK